MLQHAIKRYLDNFRGFRREVWILAIITFINRAGTMVLPFLSKYLKEDLHFSYSQIGWVMVCFGAGSMIGSWLGGKLSDKIGFYKIMVFSLFTTGCGFLAIQFVHSFEGLCVSMFGIMVIADMFRPAMFVSLSTYAKPENRTRALTLVRLAVNLGFAAGPTLGGLIIMNSGYNGLFWADGLSCIISILLFVLLVKEKKAVRAVNSLPHTENNIDSIWKDKLFLIFLFSSFATAVVFFQLFTTLPLYHKEWYGLTEIHTGLLMSMNGLLIFALEMPIVGFVERKSLPKLKIIFWGSVFMAIGFFSLLIDTWVGMLVISMLFITFGEMFCFPFSNAFAMSRAPRGFEGRYMALYTMTFSLAHMVSSKSGMETISWFGAQSRIEGYNTNWMIMGSLGAAAAASIIVLQWRLKKESLK